MSQELPDRVSEDAIELINAEEQELLVELREQAKGNLYKEMLVSVFDNSFETDYSAKRRREFYLWLTTHQNILTEAFARHHPSAHTPDNFVGTLHGSVGRGYASGPPSDIDGTIFFKSDDPKTWKGNGVIEQECYPESDWGVRLQSIDGLVSLLEWLDKEEEERVIASGPDLIQSEAKRSFKRIAHSFATLFGPSSLVGELDKTIDVWRSLVLEGILNLKHIRPELIWYIIQEEWHTQFLDYEKRAGVAIESIQNQLEEQGEEEGVAWAHAEKIRVEQLANTLPDLEAMKHSFVGEEA